MDKTQTFTYSFNGEFGWQLFVFMPYVHAQLGRALSHQKIQVIGCRGDRPLYECLGVGYTDGVPRRQMEGTEMFSAYRGSGRFAPNWPTSLVYALDQICRRVWDERAWKPIDWAGYWQKQPLPEPVAAVLDPDRPLLVIANKHSSFPQGYDGYERGQLEPNYLPLDTLANLLRAARDRYQVCYSRITWAVDRQPVSDYRDREVARKEGAVVLSDYVAENDLEAWNRLLLPVYGRCRRFLSVQGGVSYLASCFGGKNLVLCRRGIETRMKINGRRLYDYFSLLSGAEVRWTGNDDVLLEQVQDWLLATDVGSVPEA